MRKKKNPQLGTPSPLLLDMLLSVRDLGTYHSLMHHLLKSQISSRQFIKRKSIPLNVDSKTLLTGSLAPLKVRHESLGVGDLSGGNMSSDLG